MQRSARRLTATAVALAISVLGACSSDGNASADNPATTTDPAPAIDSGAAGRIGADPQRRECPVTSEAVPDATPVPGVESDLDVTTFDGTTIRAHWFPWEGATAENPAPVVLMGPGWSLAGDTSTDGAALFGAASISELHEAGYSVLTWDPRGFGASGGAASVNDPEVEGRDVRGLIGLVATMPGVALDADGDPRVGMIGFSYGGGIAITVAAIDCRVDVIVPGIAWHSLETSLYENETVKAGWAELLTDFGSTGGTVDPHVTSAAASGLGTGTLSEDDFDWFLSRGPGDLVGEIDVPTLFVQGTVDTLFPLDEATTNFEDLAGRDVPTAMLWACLGHGTCLTDPGDLGRYRELTLAWLTRYLKDDRSVDLGAPLELVDQDGVSWQAADWPVPAGEPVTASGSGTLELSEASAAGPLSEGGGDALGGIVAGVTPGRADVAVEVAVDPGPVDTMAIGAPEVTIDYVGDPGPNPDPERPTRVFAQLVDDETGFVVGNQITPIPVVLDGTERTVTVPLETIAHHLTRGRTLTLQIVATTPAWAKPALGGSIEMSRIEVTIPTSDGLTRA